MNPIKQTNSAMHFKSAQISGMEISPNDMAQINRYALSPLSPEDVFAFKVSMAGNEIDRDFEVFPRHTLSKLASLFVGKTVVKDHDHRSDNQIARIYATDLVESQPTQMTKAGEVFTELIAKCYMVKTSTNADLIAEIRAGIRKEVSLGCHIGKAICSICETDNVKTYCVHFPGKQYEGETCYFSLEQPRDAYELSFVAIPAQQHAGTVKSYGEKPCRQEEMGAETANEAENGANVCGNDAGMLHSDANLPETMPKEEVTEQNETQESASDEVAVANLPSTDEESQADETDDHAGDEQGESPKRLTVNQDEDGQEPDDSSEGKKAPSEEAPDRQDAEAGAEVADESVVSEKKAALNQLWEAAKRLMPAPTSAEQAQKISDLFEELAERLTVNQKAQALERPAEQSTQETTRQPASPSQEPANGEDPIQAEGEAEEDLKAKQAQARLRALDLSLSLRHRSTTNH